MLNYVEILDYSRGLTEGFYYFAFETPCDFSFVFYNLNLLNPSCLFYEFQTRTNICHFTIS